MDSCHLQIDADPDPAYDSDAGPGMQLITLMQIRIPPFNQKRIHADPDPQRCF